MGPGTGRSGGPRATPADTLRALAGDISDYLASRGELLQGIAADPAYAPRAASGREALAQIINRTPEEGRARFDEVFANPFMGAMPVAGIFAGMGAKTADLAKLRVAEDMAGKGAEPEAIRAATGWFQGPDAKWRFEIPDNEAFLETPRGAPPGYEALQHPDVQDAYPDLWAQLQQSIRPGPQRGKFYPDTKTIAAEGPTQDVRRSVALHELQHAIQDREGFAPGGSPTQFSGFMAPVEIGTRAADEAKYLREALEIQQVAKAAKMPHRDAAFTLAEDRARTFADPMTGELDIRPPRLEAIEAAETMGIKELRAALADAERRARVTPHQAYSRLAGEIEARDVQSRADFTPDQRAATTPYSSQGIAPEDMIVLPRSGGVQASVEPKRYEYAMRYRRPGTATLPPGAVDYLPPSEGRPFGGAVYDKPLSTDDLRSFEMEPLDPAHPWNVRKAFDGWKDQFTQKFLDQGEVYRVGKKIAVTPSTVPGQTWQLTMFGADGQPRGHIDLNDFDELARMVWAAENKASRAK